MMSAPEAGGYDVTARGLGHDAILGRTDRVARSDAADENTYDCEPLLGREGGDKHVVVAEPLQPTRKVEGTRLKSSVISGADTSSVRMPEVIDASSKKSLRGRRYA